MGHVFDMRNAPGLPGLLRLSLFDSSLLMHNLKP